MSCHKVWLVGFWKEIKRNLILWGPKSICCRCHSIIRVKNWICFI
jgi:hypothetical protein